MHQNLERVVDRPCHRGAEKPRSRDFARVKMTAGDTSDPSSTSSLWARARVTVTWLSGPPGPPPGRTWPDLSHCQPASEWPQALEGCSSVSFFEPELTLSSSGDLGFQLGFKLVRPTVSP